MLTLAVSGLMGTAYAAESGLPQFGGAPLDFVPTPMGQSSVSELLTLQEARMAGMKTSAQLPPARARILLDSRRAESRMPIVEPNPDIQYAMPIVTPDPAVDYKLHVLEVLPPAADETAK